MSEKSPTTREPDLEAAVAAFRAMAVHAPVMLEAEDWERWYQQLMTVMDRTAHMVTAEAHERADALLPEPETVRFNMLVTTVRVEEGPGHDHVHVWNRGGKAGTLTVTKGDGEMFAKLLLPGAKLVFNPTIRDPTP